MKVYTLNGKVLKNSANDKWLQKKEEEPVDYILIGTQKWAKEDLAGPNSDTYEIYPTTGWAQDDRYHAGYYSYDNRLLDIPAGWHLPTQAEWQQLFDYYGSQEDAFNALASTSHWKDGNNGNNTSGMNIEPLGYKNTNSAALYGGSDSAYYWTATGSNANLTKLACLAYSSYQGKKFTFITQANDLGNTSYLRIRIRLIKDA